MLHTLQWKSGFCKTLLLEVSRTESHVFTWWWSLEIWSVSLHKLRPLSPQLRVIWELIHSNSRRIWCIFTAPFIWIPGNTIPALILTFSLSIIARRALFAFSHLFYLVRKPTMWRHQTKNNGKILFTWSSGRALGGDTFSVKNSKFIKFYLGEFSPDSSQTW